ncbi:elongin A domain-containing protein [Sporobolomyces salmoneus]|uniref:elongin A domain-containing protein n=1 Tax=Sporobolomyces salmoneus TaxID=183962 RepID=UPI00317C66A7
MTVPSLRLLSEQILRPFWSQVRDIGDCPYEVVSNLLRLSTANQLSELEENSPHLSTHTNGLWKKLCVNDFVEIRKLVEDQQLPASSSSAALLSGDADEETESDADVGVCWRDRYFEEEEKKQLKMQQVLSKLRSQYSSLSSAKQSRQVQTIDGLRFEKRRKLTSHSHSSSSSSSQRPKSLLQKVRQNSKQINSIYAPKRQYQQRRPPAPSTTVRKVPAITTEAFPSTGKKILPIPKAAPSNKGPPPLPLPPPPPPPSSSAKSPPPPVPKRPVIKTVTRTTTTLKRSSALLNSPPLRQTSFSPPPPQPSSFEVPPARPIAQIPLRARTVSTTQQPGPSTTTKPLPSSAVGPPAARTQVLSPPGSPPPPPPLHTKPVVPQRRASTTGGLFIPKKR